MWCGAKFFMHWKNQYLQKLHRFISVFNLTANNDHDLSQGERINTGLEVDHEVLVESNKCISVRQFRIFNEFDQS